MYEPSDFTPDQARRLLEELKRRLFYLELRRARLGFDTPPGVLSELEEIREKEIPELLRMLQGVTEARIDDRAKREMDRIHQRVEQLTSEYSGINFINREEELKEITHPLARPFVLIEAPARYGKTFLLRQAKKELEKAEWFVCLVDFATQPGAAEDEMGFIKAVYDCLPDAVKPKSLPSKVARALGAVAGRMSRMGKPVALLLDSAERIQPAFAEWVRDGFIYHTEQLTREVAGAKFRCIVAGRYITQTWVDPRRKYNLGYECFGEPIRLSPFTFAVVLDTIRSWDASKPTDRETKGMAERPPLSRDAMERVARGVLTISGGHPDCLVSLLLEIDAEQNLHPSVSFFEDNRRDLFTYHVEPACRVIMRDIPKSVVDIFPYLCLFRCYNEQIVKTVLEWADKNGKLGDNAECDAGRALRLLTQHGLVVWKPEKRFYVDDVVRRIISLQRWLDEKERPLADDLNQTALGLYEEWLDDPPLLDPVRYQAMVIEHLYHLSVRLAQASIDPEEAVQGFKEILRRDCDHLKGRFKKLLGPFEWQESLNSLLSHLRADEDIQTEMSRASRGYPFEDLLEPLKRLV